MTEALADKYEILRWIGGGGMADVFLARHRIHGALFAVKVLSTELAEDQRIVARFVQEARTAATLAGQPNIVPIFDIGASNGLYYLIMQYVEGEDLAKYLARNRRLAPLDAACITCQVADALVWASAKGVVHRDLKPSNLYLDQNGRILVLDFGIAKAADVPSALTAATERLGTVYYMSPEQVQGERCDSRSDLYSLGVVFFELLSGHRPFEGDSSRAIEIAHVQTPPPDLRVLSPKVPDEFCAIVSKLLEKKPEDRYSTPADLVAALNSFGATSAPLSLRPAIRLAEPCISPEDQTQMSGPQPSIVSMQAPAAPRVSSSALQPVHPAPTPAVPSSSPPRWLIPGIIILALVAVAAGVYLFFLRPSSKGGLADIHAPIAASSETGKSTPAASVNSVYIDRLGGRMHLVPAGAFVFGNSDDHTSPNEQETVTLPAFYIDETEVSNAQYKQFCDESGHKPPTSPNFTAHFDFPVTNVSFDDAEAFARWLGKRLPNEKEWEKAARGIDGRIYPWGNAEWTDAPAEMQSVRSYPKRVSPYSSYNMAGNAAEWTTGRFPYGDTELKDLRKVLGSNHFSREWKVLKGGFFGSNPNAAVFWKTYMRRGYPRDLGSPVVGFRCVRDGS